MKPARKLGTVSQWAKGTKAAASNTASASDWTKLQSQYEDFKKVVEREMDWAEDELEKSEEASQ